MQDVGLPGRAVAGGAPHAQAAPLRLGVPVLRASLAQGRRVLRAARAIDVHVALALQALLRPLPLLAVAAPRCCIPACSTLKHDRMLVTTNKSIYCYELCSYCTAHIFYLTILL